MGQSPGRIRFSRTYYLIDDKARYFIEQSSCDVGVLVDRDFSDAGTLFLPLFGEEDAFMLNYARKFILNSKSRRSGDGFVRAISGRFGNT